MGFFVIFGVLAVVYLPLIYIELRLKRKRDAMWLGDHEPFSDNDARLNEVITPYDAPPSH